MANPSAHTNWFGHCATIAEVKAEYRRLCFTYHPDHGGDSEVMQHINQAYRQALHGGLEGSPYPVNTRGMQPQRRRAPVPAPPTGESQAMWSRDDVRRLWNGYPWQQVASNQFQRNIGAHIVTLVQWTIGHETMWAVQVGGEFSKFAFATRSEAEEEGFNLLYRRLQLGGD